MAKSTIAYQKSQNSFHKFLSWTDEKKVLAKEISRYIEPEHTSLLDVGAGNGELTKMIAHHFASITAIEPSKTLFQNLQTSLPDSNLFNSTVELFSEAKSFDFILVSHVLHYLSNPESTIRNLMSILNNRGKILIIMLDTKCPYMKYIDNFKHQVYGENKTEASEFLWTDLIEVIKNNKYSHKINQVVTKIIAPSSDDYLSINDFHFNTDVSSITLDLKNQMSEYLKPYTKNGKVEMEVFHKFIVIER